MAEEQIKAVNKVLKEIGCLDKPTLLVLNKVDRIEDRSLSRCADEPTSALDRGQCRQG